MVPNFINITLPYASLSFFLVFKSVGHTNTYYCQTIVKTSETTYFHHQYLLYMYIYIMGHAVA
jgi:hypothetical protein